MEPVSPVIPSAPEKKTILVAKDQPEYHTLPAIAVDNHFGILLSRWHMTWRERLRALFTGDVYVQHMTFGGAVQPLTLTAVPPEVK
jgi:hypothetical protein